MAASKRRPSKSPEERRAEIEALSAQLNTAVAELTSTGAWLRMLKVSAKFTKYSPMNVLYLWMQAQMRGVELTRVAGYRTWQAMGRQVERGAKSFAVIAPIRSRMSEEEADDQAARGIPDTRGGDGRPAVVVRGFKLERVFRYEDTEGEPLPEQPEVGYVTGDSDEGAWAELAGLVAAAGFTLTAEPEPGDTRGHTEFDTRRVNVDPQYELAERVHILVHELGHIRCDHGQRMISREQRETEAESVAFIVCSVLGLNMGDVATVYVGGWSDGDPKVIQAAQSAVHSAAQSLLSDLESPCAEAKEALIA